MVFLGVIAAATLITALAQVALFVVAGRLTSRLERVAHDAFIGIVRAGMLADMVLELTGSQSRIVSRPLPTDDPRVRRPDITRAREKLGWSPKVPLREGLQRTIEWFKGQRR